MYQVFDTGAYSRGQCHTMPQPKTEKILLEIFYEAKIQKQIPFNSSETSFEICLYFKTVFKMEIGEGVFSSPDCCLAVAGACLDHP